MVAGIAGFVLAGIAIAYVVATTLPVGTHDGCATFVRVELQPTERSSARVIVTVNETSSDAWPLSEFSSVLSLGGRSIAELAPLADGAAKGSLTFHDVTRPGHLSRGDNFTVSPVTSGAYQLDLFCEGHVIGRATWAS